MTILTAGPKGEVLSKVDALGHDGPTLVSYTPSEPGIHNISVIWDHKHIKGGLGEELVVVFVLLQAFIVVFNVEINIFGKLNDTFCDFSIFLLF